MNMKSQTIKFALIIILASAASPVLADDFDLSWHTMDCGGTTSATGGTLQLAGTIGQPDAGSALSGGGFEIIGGFWHGPAGPAPIPCPADIAPPGGNSVVNTDDLLAVINNWGACPLPCPPRCSADIAPPGGNCTVNVDDLLAVINAWGLCP